MDMVPRACQVSMGMFSRSFGFISAGMGGSVTGRQGMESAKEVPATQIQKHLVNTLGLDLFNCCPEVKTWICFRNSIPVAKIAVRKVTSSFAMMS